MAPQQFGKVQAYLVSTVEEYHTANPLSPGPSKETLRAATGLPARLFDQILRETPSLQEVKGSISSSQHQLVLSRRKRRS